MSDTQKMYKYISHLICLYCFKNVKSIDQTLHWETEQENNLKRSMALKKQKLKQDLCTQISERLDHELSLKEENLYMEKKNLETEDVQIRKEDLEQHQEKVYVCFCFVIDLLRVVLICYPFFSIMEHS